MKRRLTCAYYTSNHSQQRDDEFPMNPTHRDTFPTALICRLHRRSKNRILEQRHAKTVLMLILRSYLELRSLHHDVGINLMGDLDRKNDNLYSTGMIKL